MSAAETFLQFEVVNQVAIITLDRPRALNALSHEMVQQMAQMLEQVASDHGLRAVLLRGAGPKAFCAGGDVVALADSVREGTPLHRDFFIDEYRLDLRIHTYPKPVVACMHGIVMGGGMGLAQGAALRLVSEGVRIAMPETRIGLIPDVGASHFFSKMPAPLACYLALTGVTLNAADAVLSGLADARARLDDPQGLPDLIAAIAWPADDTTRDLALLRAALAHDGAATAIDGATLPAHGKAIFRHFDPARPLSALMASLADEPSEWSQATTALLRSRSPLMLALTREALLRGRHLSLPHCFQMEYGLVQHALACGEFTEGVRAHLVDRDGAPRWSVPSIEALQPQHLEQALASARRMEHAFA